MKSILIFLVFFSTVFLSSEVFCQVPLSISVKTSSYTIPSGKWAKVFVECDSGGIFTINSVNSITTSGFISVMVSTNANTNNIYTAPDGYRLIISSLASSNAFTWSINGSTGNLSDSVAAASVNYLKYPLHIVSGQRLHVSGISTGLKQISGIGVPSNATSRQATFNLPSGTIINGSGSWRATVELYER